MNRSALILAASLAALIGVPALGGPAMQAAPPMVRTTTPQKPAPRPEEGAPPPPATTYQVIVFDVFTGGDDLRSNSKAQANLQFKDGTSQTCMLKNMNDDTWENNSEHSDISCQLNSARTFDDLRLAKMQIQMLDCFVQGGGCGFGEMQDNWNIQHVRITLKNQTDSNNACLYDISGTNGGYFARLTGTTNWVEVDGHGSTC